MVNPGCLFDEEETNYEDLEGGDYPVNPFEYIPDMESWSNYEEE